MQAHQNQTLNKQFYNHKRELRTKITQLLKKVNSTSSEELVNKVETFNKKIISSMEFNIIKEVGKKDFFRFEKTDKIDEMREVYKDTRNIVKNQIKPEHLLKDNLNFNEMEMLRNDVNYFIKDPKVKGKLNFLKSKRLVDIIDEEEGKKLNDLKTQKGRRVDISGLKYENLRKNIESLQKTIASKSLILSNKTPLPKVINKKVYSNQFDAKLDEARTNLIPILEVKKEKNLAEKQFKIEAKKIPERILNDMYAQITESKRVKPINYSPRRICHNDQNQNVSHNLRTDISNSVSNTGSSNHILRTEASGYVVLTEAKLIRIEKIKSRNRIIENKILNYREKNKSSQDDERILKNRVNDIRDNFLITNLQLQSMTGNKSNVESIDTSSKKAFKLQRSTLIQK